MKLHERLNRPCERHKRYRKGCSLCRDENRHQRDEPADRRTISQKKRAEILNKTGGRCHYCGCQLGDDWQPDHFIPLSRFGLDDIRNLVPACKRCNASKSGDSIENFRLRLQLKMAEWPMQFSVNQIKFLTGSLGVKLPLPPPPVFFFEWKDKDPA